MALIKCKECGHKVSKKAKACPSCGAKPSSASARTGDTLGYLLVGGIFFAVLASVGQESQDTNSATSSSNANSSGDGSTDTPVDTLYAHQTINVRAGPSTDQKIVDQLHRGDSVEIFAVNDDWATVRLDDSAKHYVYAPLLKSEAPPKPPAPPQMQCHNLISEVLKAPGTADFPFIADRTTLSSGPNYYAFRISGEVDAENSFGATLRKRYSCVLWTQDSAEANSITWSIGEITFGGKSVVDNRPFPWK